MAPTFPPAFADLEPLAAWALPSERERNARRCASRPEELRGFYELFEPRLRNAIDHLEQFPLDGLPEPEQHLLWLTFSMAEVAFAVEKYDAQGRIPFGTASERMVPLHDA